MKKLIFISILLIVGCSTMRNMYHKNFKLDKSTAYFKIGMTEEEFIKKILILPKSLMNQMNSQHILIVSSHINIYYL